MYVVTKPTVESSKIPAAYSSHAVVAACSRETHRAGSKGNHSIYNGKNTNMDRSMLPQALFPSIVSHWDVATLVEKKHICCDWNQLCTDAIDAKQTKTTQKVCRTNDQLSDAVDKYCGYNEDTQEFSQRCS
jgi:hypothetical protein